MNANRKCKNRTNPTNYKEETQGEQGGVCVRVAGSPEVFNMLSVVFYRNSKYDLAVFQEG